MMREIAEYTTSYPHRTVDKREKNILIIYGILAERKNKSYTKTPLRERV